MPSTRADSSLGSIVAFEGHPETVSTHLRLLPTSPQILILPSVQCYLPTDDKQQPAQVHEFIQKAHDAVKARNDAARAFLQSATPANKRLVFMSGGSPSAQCLCIRHIMKHETEGDDTEAEAMFNFLVKDGLMGLESQSNKWYGNPQPLDDQAEETEQANPAPIGQRLELAPPVSLRRPKSTLPLQRSGLSTQSDEDPTTRAMRAAEALDRQTESLQPSNDLDLTLASQRRSSRRRSVSLPMYGYSDNFGDNAPFYVFGSRPTNGRISFEGTAHDDHRPKPTVTSRFSVTDDEDDSLNLPPLTAFGVPNQAASCVGESYGPTFLHTFDTETLSKADMTDLHSSAGVVFGEAPSAGLRPRKPSVTRVRSLDRMYIEADEAPLSPKSQAQAPEPASTARRMSFVKASDEPDSTSSRPSLSGSPRELLLRPKNSDVVQLSPVPVDKKRGAKSYVDRGTDIEAEAKKSQVPFVPVLPMTEDLVVHLREEVPDALLERVFNSFREGNYPVLSHSPSPDGSEADSASGHLPSTPNSDSSQESDDDDASSQSSSTQGEPTVASPAMDTDEYDPFAYMNKHQTALNPARLPVKVKRPPTPERTPAASVMDTPDGKFHEFRIVGDQTPVAVQNTLRSTLNTYFPPDVHGYHQFSFALLPELEGLWSPIFRDASPGSPRANNRRMDQIVAIGSQKGVKREFSSSIIGLLDKLGSKASGVSRSGRLDLRYLLANAIQAFTSQPLASQASDNPFQNPYLLATLILPHLETYLALHSEVRYLLLEYPPEHLSTILALQKLVGVDLMKVAQIVDSKSTDLGPFTHIRGESIGSENKGDRTLGKPVGAATNGDPLDADVSKANFLLTSEASSTGISNFIATVGKILMGVSQFYAPEETRLTPAASPEPSSRDTAADNGGTKLKARPSVLSSRFSNYGKLHNSATAAAIAASAAAAPATDRSSRVASSSPLGSSPTEKPQRPASIAETVRSSRTGRSTLRPGNRASRFQHLRPTTSDGAESFMTFDPADDSDYDMEERRLMPMFMQKPSKKPKPNTRKALKFLGLA